ncbi:hypothetical protein SEPCBS57363_001437 [Sporothrix epigloea]|uniref:Oxidoreductase, short chain dehydrogenase/reductase family superfamily n=1 Tax=Sporothrix epigloea TaxID=1892477 RepID=A0ABP0DE32_9PEZI
MPSILIVGATRGLGASLVKKYLEFGWTVYGTTRSAEGPKPGDAPPGAKWVPKVDLMEKNVGVTIADYLGTSALDAVIISAGHFTTEDLEDKGPNWDEEVRMYTTSSVAPVFIVHALHKAGLLSAGSKVVFVSSESGSITLRHEKEGGGNYAHHASKAALNMVGKLLSLDLKEAGVTVSVVHPGFMRTEMTKGVGFDQYWDDGGAVTPEEAAQTLFEWTESLDISKTGQYWAPRGPRDIGTAESVLGNNLPTPLQLPW